LVEIFKWRAFVRGFDEAGFGLVVFVEARLAAAKSGHIMLVADIQVGPTFGACPVALRVSRILHPWGSHPFLLHLLWEFRGQQLDGAVHALPGRHALLQTIPVAVIFLPVGGLLAGVVGDRLTPVGLADPFAGMNLVAAEADILVRHFSPWRLAVIEITLLMRLVATDYSFRIPRRIDNSRVCVRNLPRHRILATVLLVAPSIPAVFWFEAERGSGRLLIDILNILNWILVSDSEGGLSWGLVCSSGLFLGVFFLAAFVLFEMMVKLFSADGFVADDAVDCIQRFLDVDGEGTVGVGVGVDGRATFGVGGIAGALGAVGVGGVCRGKDLLVVEVLLDMRQEVHGRRRVARDHRVGWVIALWLRWLVVMGGLPIGQWHLLLPGEGQGLRVGLWHDPDFPTIEIDVDFEVKGILSRIG
jgi:hypothetical protein